MNRLRQVLVRGCVLNTVLSVLFFLIVAAINETESAFSQVALTLKDYLLLVLCSFVLSAAVLIFRLRMRFIFRLLIHFFVLGTVYFTAFILLGKLNISFETPATVFIAIMLYIFFYAVGCGVWFGGRYLFSRTASGRTADQQPYQNLYKD